MVITHIVERIANRDLSVLVCSQCGAGNYNPTRNLVFTCNECHHKVTSKDIQLDEGETLVLAWNALTIARSPQES